MFSSGGKGWKVETLPEIKNGDSCNEEIIEQSLFDSNLEVKKSAIQYLIDLNITMSEDKIDKINIDDDT